MMTEIEIISVLDSFHESSISNRTSKLSRERAQALEYYNMELYGDEVRGESKVVTSEVFDTVEGIATRLVKVFSSTDKAVEFVPEGPEDVDAADQKTKFCNYIFYRENNGFLTMYECIKDALIMKNGIIKVYPEISVKPTFSSYKGLTEAQAINLASDDEVEFVGGGWEIQPDGSALFDLQVKRLSKDTKIVVESVPPEELSVVGWHNSVLLDDCDFVQHRTRMSVTKLREQGLVGEDEDVTALGGAGFDEDDSSEEELARDEDISEQRVFRDSNPIQKSMWRVVVKDIVARVDYDGDGIAERRRFIRIGNSIRYNEPTDYCAYGVFAPILMPHRYIGKGYADLMMEWQRVQSTLLRQTLNNIYLQNNQRPIIFSPGGVPQADMDSVNTSGPGLPMYEKSANAIRYEAPPPIAQEIIGVSEVVRQQGETRTGMTRMSGRGINPDVVTKTATGAAIFTEEEHEREEMLCRVFAETCLKPVMKAIAHLVSVYQNKKKMIRIYNKFVEMDPSTWSESYDMAINVGLGSGTVRQTTANLLQIAELQEKAVAAGGLGAIVTPENIHALGTKIIESIGIKDPSPYWNDPATVEPKPPEPSDQDKLIAAQKEVEQVKAALQKAKIDLDAQIAEDKNDVELKKSVLAARVQMALADKKLELDAFLVQADLHKAERKIQADNDLALMNAFKELDHEDVRAKNALALEDKKVVHMKAKSIKQDGGVPSRSATLKARIKPTPDGGFEVETTRERRTKDSRRSPS